MIHFHLTIFFCLLLYTNFDGIASTIIFNPEQIYYAPQLDSFDLDLSSGKIVFHFNTLIDANTMNPFNMVLLANPVNHSAFQSLSSDNYLFLQDKPYNKLSLQGNTTDPYILVSSNDFARLKLSSFIGKTLPGPYISITDQFVNSSIGTPNIAINSSSALPVSTLTKDTLPPFLVSFSLDLNFNPSAAILNLTFSEPINAGSLQIEGLALQKAQRLNSTTKTSLNYFAFLSNNDFELIAVLDLNRSLSLRLAAYEVDKVKQCIGLCITPGSCWLSAWQPFINDTSGNPISIVAKDYYRGMKIHRFVADEIGPTLLYWDFNLDNGYLSLTFSETVYLSFFNYSGVLFTNGPLNASNALQATTFQSLRLDGPVNRSDTNWNVVSMMLSHSQLDLLKANTALMASPAAAFLVLDDKIVVDTSFSQNPYRASLNNASLGVPMPVRHFGRDVTPPELLHFWIDFDQQKLYLNFSKTISLSSIRLNQLSLQSTHSWHVGTEVFAFDNHSLAIDSPSNAAQIVFSLSAQATQQLRASSQLAISVQHTFLSLTWDFATDTATPPNNIIEIKTSAALQASELYPDQIVPRLLDWYLDLNANQLHFTFSKPMNASSADVSAVTLASSIFPSATSAQVILQPSSGTHALAAGLDQVLVQLSLSDADLIKEQPNLCSSTVNCYLTFGAGFLQDTTLYLTPWARTQMLLGGNYTSPSTPFVENPMLETLIPYQVSVAPVTAQPPSSVVPDKGRPSLNAFSLDMNSSLLTLTFSKPVQTQNINCSNILLSSDDVPSASSFPLPNPLGAYLKQPGGGPANRTLLSSFCFSSASDNLSTTLQLSQADSARIQVHFPLATSTRTTYLLASNQSVYDLFGNPLSQPLSFETSGALRAITFVPDTRPPVLQAIYLLTASNLTLYFNKAVLVSSLQLSEVFIVSRSGIELSLDGALVLTTQLRAQAIEVDIGPIQSKLALYGLSRGQTQTYLYIGSPGAVLDGSPNRNPIQAMVYTEAIREGLTLTSFRMDMDQGVLLFELPFFVDVQVLDASYIVLLFTESSVMPKNNPSSYAYPLTGYEHYELYPSQRVLKLFLTRADYHYIQDHYVMRSAAAVSVHVAEYAITDIYQHTLSGPVDLPCLHLRANTQPLFIQSVALSLSSGLLSLTFNRAVNLSSVQLGGVGELTVLTLKDSFSSPEQELRLHNLTLDSSQAQLLQIDPYNAAANPLVLDLNRGVPASVREQIMAAFPMGTQPASTFLQVLPGFAQDLSHPPVGVSTNELNATLPVAQITPDRTPPQLTAFDLDLSRRMLTLHFSEAVNLSSLAVDGFTLLQDPSQPNSAQITFSTFSHVLRNDSHLLSPPSIWNAVGNRSWALSTTPTDYSDVVEVVISTVDFNAIMLLAPNLALTPQETFLSFRRGAFYDLAHPPNPNVVVFSRYALPVRQYVANQRPPQLLAFNLSFPAATMTLQFDQVVNCSSVQISRMAFQSRAFIGNSAARGGDDVYYLMDPLSSSTRAACFGSVLAGSSASYSLFIEIVFGYADLVQMQSFPQLLKRPNATYLRLLEGFVINPSGIANLATPDGYAVEVSAKDFVPDQTPPQLLSFSLSQYHRLVLFFSKPIDLARMELPQVWLMNHAGGWNVSNKRYPLQEATLFRTDRLRMKVELNLHADFRRMRGDSLVFYSQNTTFLTLASTAAFRDTFGNPIVAPLNASLDSPPLSTALPFSAFYVQRIGPSLIRWDIDLTAGSLTLTFSSAVRPTFSMVGMSIQNTTSRLLYPQSTRHYTFKEASGIVAVPSNSSVYASYLAHLGAQDLVMLKFLGFTEASTPYYLSMPADVTVSDDPTDLLPDLQSTVVPTSHALPRTLFVPDTKPPVCMSFDLNLSAGQLILHMDEPIDLKSLVLPRITLYEGTNGSFVVLQSAAGTNSVSLTNYTSVVVSLNSLDLDQIKVFTRKQGLFDRLLLAPAAFQDLSGNSYLGNDLSTPIWLALFTPDRVPPQLTFWTLDQSATRLVLTFDEVVDAQSLQVSDLLLSSSSNLSDPATVLYPLTNFSRIEASTFPGLEFESPSRAAASGLIALRDIVVDLDFFRFDALAIQAQDQLGSNVSHTFLTVFAMSDIFGNAISTPITQQVQTLLPDTSSPQLLAFDLSPIPITSFAASTSVSLRLYFSKVLRPANVSCADLVLQSGPGQSPTEQLSLNASICQLVALPSGQNQSAELTILVSADAFSGFTSLGQAQYTTWLSVPHATRSTVDLFGNILKALPQKQALQMGAQVVRYSLDMNSGRLLFVFSKPIQPTSFSNASKLGFLSQQDARSFFFLTTVIDWQMSTYPSINESALYNNTVTSLRLDGYDLNRLKDFFGKFPQPSAFSLLVQDKALRDAGGTFYLAPRYTQSTWLSSAYFRPDSRPPRIQFSSLDMGLGILELQFDEPIDVGSLVQTRLALQSQANISSLYHTSPLPGYDSIYHLSNGATVRQSFTNLSLSLSSADMDGIKLTPSLAKNASTSFLSIEFGALTDLNGNFLESIESTQALQIQKFTNDTVPPVLSAFQLDVSNAFHAVITLLFSEPVQAHSLDPTQITLQSRYARRDGVNYTLTGGSVQSPDGAVLQLVLSAHDILQLELTYGLVRSIQTSFLTSTAMLVEDLAGNAVLPYYDGAALPCSLYTPDKTSPLVDSIDFDLNTGIVQVNVNVPVDLATVRPTRFSVELLNGSRRLSLSTSSIVQNVADVLSTQIILQISLNDLDTIKYQYPLAVHPDTTWFAFSHAFFLDWAGNAVAATTSPVPVGEYTPDTTRPVLLDYSLDMVHGTLHLTFSETIRKVNVDQLVLQSTPTRRFGQSFALNGSSFRVPPGVGSNHVIITMTKRQLDHLKFLGIGTFNYTSYLTWSTTFAADNSGNFVLPIYDASILGGQPVAPSPFYPDNVRPRLQRWFIDRDPASVTFMRLFLFFDEPIQPEDLSLLYLSYGHGHNNLTQQVYPIFATSAALTHMPGNQIPPVTLAELTANFGTNFTASLQLSNLSTEASFQLPNYCLSPVFSYDKPCPSQDVSLTAVVTKNFGLYDFLQTPTDAVEHFTLSAYPQTFSDLAAVPNALTKLPIGYGMLEGAPDCSPCPVGFFVSQRCTSAADRQCSPCTTCADGFYAFESCQKYRDTSCKVCAGCPYGYYAAVACQVETVTANMMDATQFLASSAAWPNKGPGHDTQCKPCTQCRPNLLEFPIRPCSRSHDTICQSCKLCEFDDLNVKQFCTGDASGTHSSAYSNWYKQNCCFDRQGRKIPCVGSVPFSNVKDLHVSNTGLLFPEFNNP